MSAMSASSGSAAARSPVGRAVSPTPRATSARFAAGKMSDR
jgi:hypothetical protein